MAMGNLLRRLEDQLGRSAGRLEALSPLAPAGPWLCHCQP